MFFFLSEKIHQFRLLEISKKKMNKHKNLKKTLKENVEELSMHGLPRISKARNTFFKVVWTTFSIVSIVLCGLFICQNIQQYLNFSYLSNIEYIYENPIEFPTVSFCSASSGFENRSLQSLLQNCLYENDDRYFKLFHNVIYLCLSNLISIL